MPNYRTAITTACALVALTATAACTENPPGSTLPTPTSTPTNTPSAPPTTPQPPAMPAAAKAKSKAGLEALGRYWLDARSYLVQTGDPRPFSALNTATCEWCGDVVDVYGGVHKAGGHYEGDLKARFVEVQLAGLAGADLGYVQFRAVVPAHVKVPKAGASPEPKKSATLDYTLNMKYAGGRWTVTRAEWSVVKGGS